MPERREARSRVVKQETNCWMGAVPDPRIPAPPRESMDDRVQRLMHEHHDRTHRGRFRLDCVYETYTEPLAEMWRDSNLKLIPNAARTLVELHRFPLHLGHDHVISMRNQGDMEAGCALLGDRLPTFFYRTTLTACWRLYRFFRHSHRRRHGQVTSRNSMVEESADVTRQEGKLEERERRHQDQHELVEALSRDCHAIERTRRAFLQHLTQVKSAAISREREALGQAAPDHVTFQLVVPFPRYRAQQASDADKMAVMRKLKRQADADNRYLAALRKAHERNRLAQKERPRSAGKSSSDHGHRRFPFPLPPVPDDDDEDTYRGHAHALQSASGAFLGLELRKEEPMSSPKVRFAELDGAAGRWNKNGCPPADTLRKSTLLRRRNTPAIVASWSATGCT